jgi:hypothetical protein
MPTGFYNINLLIAKKILDLESEFFPKMKKKHPELGRKMILKILTYDS